jgi:hypothetical protein
LKAGGAAARLIQTSLLKPLGKATAPPSTFSRSGFFLQANNFPPARAEHRLGLQLQWQVQNEKSLNVFYAQLCGRAATSRKH